MLAKSAAIFAVLTAAALAKELISVYVKPTLTLRMRRQEPRLRDDVIREFRRRHAAGFNDTMDPFKHSEVISRQLVNPQGIISKGISYVDVGLGTPSQRFRVVMDTGSTELWVARANGCTDDGRENAICSGNTFHEPSSSTKILSDKLVLRYGSGAVDGVYAEETNFIMGDPKCKNKLNVKGGFKFGLGIQHQGMADMDGILGMTYQIPKEYWNPGETKGTSMMEQLISDGMDDKFSTYVKRCNPPALGNKCKDGGILTMGKHDTQHCGKELTTVNIKGYHNPGQTKEFPFPSHWTFDAESVWIEIGGKKAGRMDQKFETITDSGTSGMLLPRALVAQMQALLPSDCQEQQGVKFCRCDLDFKVFVKINGVTIPIEGRDMMLTATSDKSYCQVLFMESDDEFIFGDPFVRSVCHHHFWKEKKITFAEMKK